MQTTPWIIEAGEFYAEIYAQTESTDQLTRKSAETKWGIAKDLLAKATSTVAYLNACLTLEVA